MNHATPSPTPTAVSQSCMTEKFECSNRYDQEFQEIYVRSDIESSPTEKSTDQRQKEKKDIKDRGCCVRCCYCVCLPKWARYAVWSFILAVLLVIIILGSIFATFKMPTFEFVGLIDASGSNADSSLATSALSVSNGKFSYRFGLQVNVNNPNIFPLHFSKMNATAYYPSDTIPYSKTPIGGGYLRSQWIPAKTNLTFMYPFHIDYDPSLDADQGVLSSLTDRCGLTGNQPQDLLIDYSIQLDASALFVTIHPVIASSAQFPCPIDYEKFQQNANSDSLEDTASDSMLSLLK
ncbi:hypothetical protein BCR42DRAFT_426040 [Absidia repens]|uniref:Late embryogenesis abundant protein LEA-2 subgroup domain-containing protein n=1 Tax=Absidia repens TaxID=90262 RepID=A0A1X2I281_9FUNG|nr:hypothetical protein BCR42DRAFT_426040 [Absidia repens]